MDSIKLTSPATGLPFELLFDSDGNAHIKHALNQCVVPVQFDGNNILISLDYMPLTELTDLASASKMTGVSRQAIRKAYDKGRIRGVMMCDGKVYVAVEDIKRVWCHD